VFVARDVLSFVLAMLQEDGGHLLVCLDKNDNKDKGTPADKRSLRGQRTCTKYGMSGVTQRRAVMAASTLPSFTAMSASAMVTLA
jgi:hypothetical protein